MRFYLPTRNSFCIVATARLYPTHAIMPVMTPVQTLQQATERLITALRIPHPLVPLTVTQRHLSALEKLADIFHDMATPRQTSEGGRRDGSRKSTPPASSEGDQSGTATRQGHKVTSKVPIFPNNTGPTDTSAAPTSKEGLKKQPRRHTVRTRQNSKTQVPIIIPEQYEPLVTYNVPTPKATKIPEIKQKHTRKTAMMPPVTRSHRAQTRARAQPMYGQMALTALLQFTNSINKNFVPSKLVMDEPRCMHHRALAGVVDPDTRKTLTKYKDIIRRPSLKKLYIEAMCKELGRLSQGYRRWAPTAYVG